MAHLLISYSFLCPHAERVVFGGNVAQWFCTLYKMFSLFCVSNWILPYWSRAARHSGISTGSPLKINYSQVMGLCSQTIMPIFSLLSLNNTTHNCDSLMI